MSGYRIEVDLVLRQGHGVCAAECPEAFEVVAGAVYPQVRVKNAQPGDSLREKAENAAAYCPNRVIRIVES